jgi:hypothetical protein
VQRQVVYRYPISGGWPGSFESFHRAGMFVIFLLCISVFASDRDKTDEPPHE